MLRSMYSGISGLKNFQTKLDVIGNNISNVNTYGFKKGRVVFKDLISQTTAGASGPTASTGGTNAKQVGLGSQIAAIDTIHGTGSLQTTSRSLDLAISGDGFFMVANSNGTKLATTNNEHLTSGGFSNISYTRAGNFYMDEQGYLVNSDGMYMVGVRNLQVYDGLQGGTTTADISEANSNADTDKGYITTVVGKNDLFSTTAGSGININATTNIEVGPIMIPTNAQSMSIAQDGTVNYVDVNGNLQVAGQLLLANFPNEGGLEKSGSNYYNASANSGNPFIQVATQGGMGSIQSGFLEMSNVDLSEEFTEMIVAQRGFQANSRIITTSDEILQELVNLKR